MPSPPPAPGGETSSPRGGGELPQELVLFGAEVGGGRDQHVHEQVAAPAAA